jgi:hypothetical protein
MFALITPLNDWINKWSIHRVIAIFMMIFIGMPFILVAQDTIREKSGTQAYSKQFQMGNAPILTLEANADLYYTLSTDSASILNNRRELYSIVGPRTEQFGINTVRFAGYYAQPKLRAKLALFWGDIPNLWIDPFYKNINEAFVGLKIAKGLWIDVGIMPPHFGMERASRDYMVSSLSITTWHSPFLLGAVRCSYAIERKSLVQLLVFNHYSTIIDTRQRPFKAFGMYADYNISSQFRICYNNVFDRLTPLAQNKDLQRWNVNNHLHLEFQSHRWLLLVGGYFGFQQDAQLASKNQELGTAYMYSSLVTARFNITERFSCAGRYEFFSNEDNFLQVPLVFNSPYQQHMTNQNLTLSLEYAPFSRSYVRIEGRYMQTGDNEKIFTGNNGQTTNARLTLMLTVGASITSPNLYRTSKSK